MLGGYHPDHPDRILRFRRVCRWRARQRPIRVRLNPLRRGPGPGGGQIDPLLSTVLGQSGHLGWPQFLQASLGDALVDVSVCMLPAWPGARRLMKSRRAGRGPANEKPQDHPIPPLSNTLSIAPDTAGGDPVDEHASTGLREGDSSALELDRASLDNDIVPPSPPHASSPPRLPLPVDPWLTAPDTPPQRVADTRRQPMRLSALFKEFCQFLRVEKGATPATIATYRWCFGDFVAFVMKQVGGTVLLAHFTEETCRSYQYDLAGRELKSGTIRVRVATLGSFGKWMVRRDKLVRNPVDRLTRPRRKARVPAVPTWESVKKLLRLCDPRERAILALMAFGRGRCCPSLRASTGHGEGWSRGAGGLAGSGPSHPA